MAASKLLMDIGDRLRLCREEMGLTQKEAAKLLEISETFYGEIERGIRRLSIERMLLVRERMGMDLTYLLSGDRINSHALTEICRQCPREKEEMMLELFHHLVKLYE